MRATQRRVFLSGWLRSPIGWVRVFLQLHTSFGPDRLAVLDGYLASLPADFACAVEVRHPAFFDGSADEAALNALLRARGVDRVLFDTRGLFASTASDEASLDAKRRKPRVPFRQTTTGRRPFVRFVGDPVVENNDAAFTAWAQIVAGWMGQGLTPFVFLHHPDDAHAPSLCRRFQAALHAATPLAPPPPAWPCEQPAVGQLSLF